MITTIDMETSKLFCGYVVLLDLGLIQMCRFCTPLLVDHFDRYNAWYIPIGNTVVYTNLNSVAS